MRTGAQASKVRGKCLAYPRCNDILASVSYLLDGTWIEYHNGRRIARGCRRFCHFLLRKKFRLCLYGKRKVGRRPPNLGRGLREHLGVVFPKAQPRQNVEERFLQIVNVGP